MQNRFATSALFRNFVGKYLTNTIAMANILLQPGTLLRGGTYRVERALSSGGFGNTYVVTNTNFDETYAMKEFYMKDINLRDGNTVTVSIPDHRATFDMQRNKFLKEAKRLRKLNNEHIVGVHDLFEENGTSYYIMDFIDGEALNARMKRTGQPLREDEVRGILGQLLDALDAIHQQGIWHLDLKPGNIMVNSEGKVTLIDFGASKQMGMGEGVTTSSGLCYTPGYAPIEQIEQNLEKLGPWTDIYALGATVCNLLTNKPLPSPMDLMEYGEEALNLPASVSPQLRQAVVAMMQSSRMRRPQSIAEVRALLSDQPKPMEETAFVPRTPQSEETRVVNTPPPLVTKKPEVSSKAMERTEPHVTGHVNKPQPLQSQPKSRPVWPFVAAGALVVLLLLAGGGIFLGSKLLSNKGNTVETDTISADVNMASLTSTPDGAEAMPTPEADERMQPADATPTSDNIPNGSEVRDTPPTQPANTATGKPQNATKDNPDQLRRAEEIETPPAPRPEDNKVFDVVEVMPSFPGDVRTWLAQHVKYPALAEENGIQGLVIVSFVIEKNGSISNVQVLRSPDPSLASEAVRVVKSMPRWTPGRQNGKPVRVKYSVPVTFRLQ